MELKGIGLVAMRTFVRSYFDTAAVDESVIKTVQPSGVRLFSAKCDDFIGAGTLTQFKEAIPALVKETKKTRY